ncbi:hypothetical protein FSP39_000740 [Pinctada imbricata]|uniref:Uncharacterized protein n=1 Tax=Pinctada imbricata TaxID=66713 RepID=A0AA88Y2F2_PINIB|nr:hypothetical protein FSP39_000740 [Pinctada imbricata]
MSQAKRARRSRSGEIKKKKEKWPGSIDEVYPEPFLTIPLQPKEKKPGQLTQKQLKQYFEEGYCVVEDFFKPEELQPCRDAIDKMVDNLAEKLYKAGKIKDKYEEDDLFHRLTKLEKEHEGSNILLFKSQKMPKAFQDLWCNDRLLNIMEQLLGPEVAGHPVWNLRTKTPNSLAMDIPWHQDSAYFSNESYDHMIATSWIPFLDTNEQNGCMQVAKNGHRKGKVAAHQCCAGPTWYVMLEEDEMEKELDVDLENDVITLPIKYGGFLLFNNLTPHRSLRNVSDNIRWSVDLRWQSPEEHWGFYEIGEGVLFRSAKNKDITPNFDKFLSVDRKEVWAKKYFKQVDASDPFDTTITGPWIGKWEVVNHNKHTDAFKPAEG